MIPFCLPLRVNVNVHHQMRASIIQMWRMRRYQPRNKHISKENYHSSAAHSHHVLRVHLHALRDHGVLMTGVKIKFLLKLLTMKYLLINVKCTLLTLSESALQRHSKENVFWKYAANLQENIHAEVWFPIKL